MKNILSSGFAINSFVAEDNIEDAENAPLAAEELEKNREKKEKNLEQEFEQLIVGSIVEGLDARKLEKKPQAFEASLPFSVKSSAQPSHNKDHLPMKILIKKKNKPVTREIPRL